MSGSDDAHGFPLLDSAGVGLIGIGADGTVIHANASLFKYLEADSGAILGKDKAELKTSLVSPDFWKGLEGDEPFYCLVPARNHLLIALCRNFGNAAGNGVSKVVLLRPYGLEREFMRMRSRLSRNIVLDINSHLSSVAVAGEIILQPELRDDERSRSRFLSTFFGDITGLSDLFVELQEVAEPVPFPHRVRFSPLDWKGLVTDLLKKTRGLANDRNVSIESDLAGRLPAVRGDYHWLYLALFGVLNHAAAEAPALGEITVTCRDGGGGVETVVEYSAEDAEAAAPWPPPTRFALPREDPRISVMEISELAVSCSILSLHGGNLGRDISSGKVTFVSRLPA